MEQLPQLITIQKAATILGVTPLTLRNWDKAGKLVALRHPMNNYRVYRREDIEKLIATMNSEPKPTTPPRRKSGPKKLEVQHLGEETNPPLTEAPEHDSIN